MPDCPSGRQTRTQRSAPRWRIARTRERPSRGPAPRTHLWQVRGGVALMAVLIASVLLPAGPSGAQSYTRISGAGSTWSANAIEEWVKNVSQFDMRVDYSATGSSDGRRQFIESTVDFAVSEIPFVSNPQDGSAPENPSRGYAYMPIVAGGTAFTYNLQIGGQRVTNLRLSGEVIAKIFTGVINRWSDPAIAADNPSLALPDREIVPVVRSDGSGTSAQFSTWMSRVYPDLWNDFCGRVGKPVPCGFTSYYPTFGNAKAQSGSLGVFGYVQQAYGEGSITYVEYSYPFKSGFPVVKMLNSAGYYVEPNHYNTAVGLLGAGINTDAGSADYLTQQLDGVYGNGDPRAYPLSSYSYMILPTQTGGSFTQEKGSTLGAFSYYFLCEGQQLAPQLGYSPLPINLVQAGLDQVRRIPGVQTQDKDIANCNNPTFSPDGTNRLAVEAPMPPECDRQGGPSQCLEGTGGATESTPVSSGASGEGGAGAGGGAGGGASGANQVAAGSGDLLYDPDTGELLSGSGSSGKVLAGSVGLAPESGWGLRQALMALAALALLGVVVVPPLVSQRLAKRRAT